MRPSRLFLLLLLAGLCLALVCVAVPSIPADWALLPAIILMAAFAVDWLTSTSGNALSLHVDHGEEVFTGEATRLDLTLTGKMSEGLYVEGKLACEAGLTPPAVFAFVADFNGLTCEVPVKATLRGNWRIETLFLKWTSRFGLIEFMPRHRLNLSMAVVPNIRPITSGEIDLTLRSTLFGMKETAWRGEGSEFHQMTEYVAGMDPRSIDWKHSARHQKMLAKEKRAERNHQIIMALDNGQLMREEISGLPKIDHMINAALALTWAGVQSGDLVGMFGFDARPGQYVPPAPGQKTFARLRHQMVGLDYKTVATNHTLGLSFLHQKLQKRSMIVVFSDFADPLSAELLLDHLANLNRRHVLVFVSLRDPLLDDILNAPTGNLDAVAQAVSAGHLLQERRSVLDQMASMGIHVIETLPGNMTPKLLSAYLAIKGRDEI